MRVSHITSIPHTAGYILPSDSRAQLSLDCGETVFEAKTHFIVFLKSLDGLVAKSCAQGLGTKLV